MSTPDSRKPRFSRAGHSRPTFLANHLTEAQMCKFFGWVLGSKMPAFYVHLSGRDIDTALMKHYGLEPKSKSGAASLLQPRTCSRCEDRNPAANRFCQRCGMILDPDESLRLLAQETERREADDVLDSLLEHQEFKSFLLPEAEGACSR